MEEQDIIRLTVEKLTLSVLRSMERSCRKEVRRNE
nr:MAG TPA: hypothetical protein [Caudoviricetes sp.]